MDESFPITEQPIGSGVLHEHTEFVPNAETDSINSLLQSNIEFLGSTEVTAIGDSGYVIQVGDRQPVQGNDWVLYDLDDTLIAYSGAKSARLEAYQKYLSDTGLSLSVEDCLSLLDTTDRFARWQESGVEMYHIEAHKAALAYATEMIRLAPDDQKSETIAKVQNELLQIKTGEMQEHNPLAFVGGQVVRKDGIGENVEEVFRPMIEPPKYEDAIDSLADVGSSEEGKPPINTGLFTYGEPAFQLEKAIELIKARSEQGKATPLTQIWLTKTPKGQFIQELARMDTDGVVFGTEPHTVLLVDDNPKELDNFFEAGGSNEGHTTPVIGNTRLGVIRSKRAGTKTEGGDWGKPGHSAHESLARGTSELSGEQSDDLLGDIYTYLLNNLSKTAENYTQIQSPHPELTAKINARTGYYLSRATSSAKPKLRVTLNTSNG